MSGDAPSAQDAPTPEPAVPVIELDRALAPIRRLAAWASADPATRGSAVPYVEATVARWVGTALALPLPEPLAEVIEAQREAVEGYDAADADGRAERLASLYQAVARADALLGLPLDDVRIRRPKKPRLPDWRVEEVDEAEEGDGSTEGADAAADGEDDSGRSRKRSRGRSRRRSGGKPEVAPPPPPLWNGKVSEKLENLPMPEDLRAALAAQEIHTVGDLLFLRPLSTERLKPVHGAGRKLPDGEERAAIGGRVLRRWTVLRPDATREVRVRLKGAGVIDLVWAPDAPELAASGGIEAWTPGERVIVVGRPETTDGTTVLCDAERAWDDGAGGVRLRGYQVDGVDDVALRGWIGRLLPLVGNLRDLLPGAELSRHDLEPIRNLLVELHHKNEERARRRMAFDEALLVQIGLSVHRYKRSRDRGLQLAPMHSLITRLAATNGLELDDEQQLVFEDIKRDLRLRTPMRRVLAGPVGSGRGRIALLTMVAVAEGKVQVLVIGPDPQEAEARYLFSALTLREGGLVARLIEGEPTKAERDAIGRGEIHVVFGTRELLTAGLDFRRLGLVVAEERESVGFASKAIADMKSPRPHLLAMPAVPVGPRLALTAFADHDISTLEHGAPVPKVTLFPTADRSVVYGRAAEVVGDGGQVVVVFPQVKGADALDLREAWRLVRALESDAFGKARMGLFHGAMSREDRLQAYEDFENRRLDVLVATAPIEGAPPAGRARAMVLEQAERFSPHRLARLRGYLAPDHGDPVVWCVCAGDPAEVASKLTALTEGPRSGPTPDELARDDAPELPELTWLDLDRDAERIWEARAAAHRILRSDARLRSGWTLEVGRALRDRWSAFYGDGGPSLELEAPPKRTETSESGGQGGRKGSRRRRRRRRR